MHPVLDFFNSLPFSESVRRRLGNPVLLKAHHFFLGLPESLAIAFPGVTKQQVQELQLSNYLYFRFFIYFDDLVDGDADPSKPSELEIFTAYLAVHERAIRGLTDLLGASHPFWDQLTRCQLEFVRAQQYEREIEATRQAWTLNKYEEVAAGKAAVCSALVYALQGLAPQKAIVEPMLDCLRHFHIAVQLEDDVLDFLIDWEKGHYTYAHEQVFLYLREKAGLTEEPLTPSPKLLHQYFYASGTAVTLLKMAQEHYKQAKTQAHALGLPGVIAFAEEQLFKSRERLEQIDYQFQAATARATQALINKAV